MTNQRQTGQFLTFVLNAQDYGLPIASVVEINRVGDIAPVPQTPPFMAGVMNLRGKVIPVVNMRLKLGFPDVRFTRETCIIVIEGECGQIAAIVDSVTGVSEFAADQVEPPPIMGDMERLRFVIGIGKAENKVYILIDAVQALSRDNLLNTTPTSLPAAA